eukprot:128417-Prorocentrum_minimum.AAC.1
MTSPPARSSTHFVCAAVKHAASFTDFSPPHWYPFYYSRMSRPTLESTFAAPALKNRYPAQESASRTRCTANTSPAALTFEPSVDLNVKNRFVFPIVPLGSASFHRKRHHIMSEAKPRCFTSDYCDRHFGITTGYKKNQDFLFISIRLSLQVTLRVLLS